ncbi:MAG TPA: SDR family NAD(P)-dependent oxidoreductase [Myxococcaceae bacterium]|jgi:NAD(P)-dependent dehydrogenase (short-subunit alcohol dehydrogenase family)
MPTPQAPIASDFNRNSTAAEVIRGHDLRGKTAIVTGGSAGIGLETTRVLSTAGARVIVPARDLEKARAAVGKLATVEPMELTDPASIAAFADRFLKAGTKLDLLIDNAGIMANPLTRVARNIESQFATNHVGHFELTVRLWPALLKTQAPRIISLSSVGHRRSPVDFDDWNFERKPYDRWVAYGQSKSANALFAIGANARGVKSFSVHPGGILTGLGKFMTPEETDSLVTRARNMMKTVEQGAATTVWAAVSHQLDALGGVYCENCNIAEPVPADSQETRGVRPWAMDPALAERLWALSEKITGLKIA